MFTDDQREIFEQAIDTDPPEASMLVDAYRELVPALAGISPDGWVVQGREIAPIVAGLFDRVEALPDQRLNCTDGDRWPSDEVLLERLGPGTIYDPDPQGRRLYRPTLVVELHELRQEAIRLESAAGVVALEDEDGWFYTRAI